MCWRELSRRLVLSRFTHYVWLARTWCHADKLRSPHIRTALLEEESKTRVTPPSSRDDQGSLDRFRGIIGFFTRVDDLYLEALHQARGFLFVSVRHQHAECVIFVGLAETNVFAAEVEDRWLERQVDHAQIRQDAMKRKVDSGFPHSVL